MVARDICSSQLAIEVTRVKLSLTRLAYIRISRSQIEHYETVVLRDGHHLNSFIDQIIVFKIQHGERSNDDVLPSSRS